MFKATLTWIGALLQGFGHQCVRDVLQSGPELQPDGLQPGNMMTNTQIYTYQLYLIIS